MGAIFWGTFFVRTNYDWGQLCGEQLSTGPIARRIFFVGVNYHRGQLSQNLSSRTIAPQIIAPWMISHWIIAPGQMTPRKIAPQKNCPSKIPLKIIVPTQANSPQRVLRVN